MAVLRFSITPDATSRIYEALTCLAKFGESVSIEARSERITLTALNSSKTAYASFALDRKSFFIDYQFDVNHSASGGDRFTCQLLNKALQSAFKGRSNEFRARDTAIERCDVTIQDQPDKTECRFIVKMVSKHGMTKTYRLTYESVEVMHALFDKLSATQGWRISSRILREYIEYFGPKTEQLDLLAQDGKAIFTSFTEKISDGKEVLKQPLETAIAIHTDDFEDFHMQEGMHIVISVKDFRAIVTHAETQRGQISAFFSSPTRPLQFSYQSAGMHCEFTLMTTGNFGNGLASQNPSFVSTRSFLRQPSLMPSLQERPGSTMPPPARPNIGMSVQVQRPSLREQASVPEPSRSSMAPEEPEESLFIPDRRSPDEDRAWNPPNYDRDDDDDEMLGWDASIEHPSASSHPTFQDSGTAARAPIKTRVVEKLSQEGLEPTQRLSQLHGMFD